MKKYLVVILLIFSMGASAQNKISHTVQKGETLYKISSIYTIPLSQLMQDNKLVKTELKVGQVLIVNYTISENTVEQNKINYEKDLILKGITKNKSWLKTKMENIEAEKKNLDIDKDVIQLMSLAKDFKLIKDSINFLNLQLQKDIKQFDVKLEQLAQSKKELNKPTQKESKKIKESEKANQKSKTKPNITLVETEVLILSDQDLISKKEEGKPKSKIKKKDLSKKQTKDTKNKPSKKELSKEKVSKKSIKEAQKKKTLEDESSIVIIDIDEEKKNIEISEKQKAKLEKKVKKENAKIIAENTKKDEEISFTENIDEVEVQKSKKKIKYSFGDQVDQISSEKAMFFLSRAKIEIDKQNVPKAKEFIEKSLKLNPSYSEAYALKGDIYSSLKYYDRAINFYDKASELNPKAAQLHYNKGNCYIRLENYKKAIEEWTMSIALDSNYILAYAGRASIYIEVKEYEKAIKDYDQIFKINKYYYVAYKGRGLAYLENGDFGKSIIDFNNFLEYEPEDNFVFWKRGMAKLYDNNIFGGCLDLLSASEAGHVDAEKALKKHCEK